MFPAGIADLIVAIPPHTYTHTLHRAPLENGIQCASIFFYATVSYPERRSKLPTYLLFTLSRSSVLTREMRALSPRQDLINPLSLLRAIFATCLCHSRQLFCLHRSRQNIILLSVPIFRLWSLKVKFYYGFEWIESIPAVQCKLSDPPFEN